MRMHAKERTTHFPVHTGDGSGGQPGAAERHTLTGTRLRSVRSISSSDRKELYQISTTLITNLILCADDSASVAGSESTIHEINADAAAHREEALLSDSELLPIEEETEGASAGETAANIDEQVAEEADQ